MQPQPQPRSAQTDRVRTVSEINAEARFLIEERFRRVWIEGEISNFRPYASGHWYFTLQDDRAQLRCVMFSSANRFVRFRPSNGLSVVTRGRLSIYEGRGSFQAIVDHIEPAGEGALRAALEKLKARLAAQGLFDETRKRDLPSFPRHVAVISSRAGAALRDVIAVIRRRFPCIRVTCFDVAVQGFEAEGEIIAAFDRAEFMRHPPDVIVLTRGGGSLEDLAAFNLESVARRIAAARIPVVSAVGHETDVTIADFVADRRAPTPSAAAEMVTPDRLDVENRLRRVEDALVARIRTRLDVDQRLLGATTQRLVHPGRTVEQRMLRTDELGERLLGAMSANLARSRTNLLHRVQLLARCNPAARLAPARERVVRATSRLRTGAAKTAERAEARLATLSRALNAVSPLATLARGFAIVAKPDDSHWGQPVVSVSSVERGDTIVAHLADGAIHANVEGTDTHSPKDGE
ncbi:MAG: exodeoxyribonuclease VII large subunit [Gammaproteobacteria bacterium]|nr:exodeoxyribonuclease VII large subunit [Gammaproteobacteria bacterium]MYK45947.1 exodeoxyribonuclease VII large subunit [Gammaproteobacteria bacterium]